MSSFKPLDGDVQWNIRRGIETSHGYAGVFGTDSPYEAYLFVLAVKLAGGQRLLGAGCSEQEVEDLVDSAKGPVLLFLVDRIAKDCGVALVRRLKERRSDLKTMLLVNFLEAYASNPDVHDVYDGITTAGSIGRDGIFRCIQAVTSGKRYLDSLLEEVQESSDRSLWNNLNQREREIIHLLAKGMKNRDIARELFIAETTARDYVSSILSKLQVLNRTAAVAWASQHGFLASAEQAARC